ncbi:hypothetical protein BS78_01G394200 [Paspalum vaginatum]|nr:hypothetical protein BS78_01G394200 [Paspalum vaginatum]
MGAGRQGQDRRTAAGRARHRRAARHVLRALPSTQNEFFLGLLLALRNPRFCFFFSSSCSSSSPRAWASLGRCGSGGAVQLTPARGSTRSCRDPLQSLIPFLARISRPMCVDLGARAG